MAKPSKKKSSAAPSKLTPKQLRAIDLILSPMSLTEVAAQLHLSRQTLSEWKNQHPAFKAKLEELREDAEEELSNALPMNENFMMGQLRQLAREASPEIRLKAIQWYFERFGHTDLQSPKNHPLLNPLSGATGDLLSRAVNLENV